MVTVEDKAGAVEQRLTVLEEQASELMGRAAMIEEILDSVEGLAALPDRRKFQEPGPSAR